ncbi:hypothetical protein [Alkalihalobacillus pseudalcaliphilus]|uniref:hypothetical protein n=1 Tax=Alkalihalobacillus pseudalcaliphilus TaxID=79884 RepID=UPI00064D7D03|nr:hypothetical protein [Alkalihalobacillus pseudalcaliphilus]KMK75790.1 hypothetical protein AB990_11010 [Alkalihalobacillus pseudalcaliphilus]
MKKSMIWMLVLLLFGCSANHNVTEERHVDVSGEIVEITTESILITYTQPLYTKDFFAKSLIHSESSFSDPNDNPIDFDQLEVGQSVEAWVVDGVLTDIEPSTGTLVQLRLIEVD